MWHSTSKQSGNTYKTSSPIPGQPTGTTIKYKVKATDGAGNSGETSVYQVVVGCVDTSPPPAPSSITVPSSSSTGEYTISWSSVVDNGCSGLKHYELEESGAGTRSINTTSTNASITVSKSGTYYYRVRAWGNAGNDNHAQILNILGLNNIMEMRLVEVLKWV